MPLTLGAKRAVRTADGLPVTSNYLAYATGICKPDGRIVAAWRRAYDHYTSVSDGADHLEMTYSDDDFASFPPAAGYYHHFPLHNGNLLGLGKFTWLRGGIWATMFRNSDPRDTVVTQTYDDGFTWSTPVSVLTDIIADLAPQAENPNLLNATRSHIAEDSAGVLWTTCEIPRTGHTHRDADIFSSADGGVTWSHHLTLANGDADGRPYGEPDVVYDAQRDRLVCAIREGGANNNRFYIRHSSPPGQNWSPLTLTIDNHGQAPSLGLHNGLVYSNGRNTGGNRETKIYRSLDGGVTWSQTIHLIDTTGSFLFALYGDTIRKPDGSLGIIWAGDNNTKSGDAATGRIYYRDFNWTWSPLPFANQAGGLYLAETE